MFARVLTVPSDRRRLLSPLGGMIKLLTVVIGYLVVDVLAKVPSVP